MDKPKLLFLLLKCALGILHTVIINDITYCNYLSIKCAIFQPKS